jgi:hypothetical protein
VIRETVERPAGRSMLVRYTALATRIGNVVDLFTIRGRGLVVMTGTPLNELPIPIRIGDPVEIRNGPALQLRTVIRGIEHADPSKPTHPFVFMTEVGITKEQVPVGSEVWHVGDSAAV